MDYNSGSRFTFAFDKVSNRTTMIDPAGPSASWTPQGDIHVWYKEFARCLGHKPNIKQGSYSYNILRNLEEPTTRSGNCVYEVWKVR